MPHPLQRELNTVLFWGVVIAAIIAGLARWILGG
jgi:hypothetical protein